MPKTEQLDLALPIKFLQLGEVLSETNALRRSYPRTDEHKQPTADDIEALVDAILPSCNATAVRQLLGLRRTTDRTATRIRLKAVAILGWRGVRLSEQTIAIGRLAAVCLDPKAVPKEALLRSHHEIGTMIAEDTLVGSADATGAFNRVQLSERGLEFMAGGKSSLGLLTARKLSRALIPKGLEEYEQTPANAPIPSAKLLRDRICEQVLGIDRVVSVFAGDA